MKKLLACLPLIVATASGLPTLGDEPKGDLARLQGSWSAKVGPNKDIPVVLTLKGDSVELKLTRPSGEDLRLRGKIKLDEQSVPKTLDWYDFTNPQGDEIPINRALYKLEGDAWTVCNGGPGNQRPAKFEAGEGGPPTLTTWARVQEKPAEPAPIAGDLGKFQGTWTGKAGTNQQVAITLTIKAGEITAKWQRGDDPPLTFQGEIRLNDQANPKTLDLFHLKRSDGREAPDHLGIYAFDGDKVKICTAGPGDDRPAEFKAGDGGPPDLYVLTRKKD